MTTASTACVDAPPNGNAGIASRLEQNGRICVGRSSSEREIAGGPSMVRTSRVAPLRSKCPAASHNLAVNAIGADSSSKEPSGSRSAMPSNRAWYDPVVCAGATPSVRARVTMAATIGVVFGGAAFWYTHRMAYLNGHDFGYVWRGAQALANGDNPWAFLKGGLPYGVGGPLLYPPPAVVLALPLTVLNVYAAAGVFFGVSAALFAFALSQVGWWRLWVLVGPGMVYSFLAVNFPPLVAASMLLPAVGWLAVLKPTLGIVSLAYRPRLVTIVAIGALAVASFIIFPTWLADALGEQAKHSLALHRPPITFPLGFLGLVGLLRWRTSEGRLLAAFTLVPVSVFPYDSLLLFLIPRTPRHLAILLITSWITAPAALGANPEATPTELLVCTTILQLGVVVPCAVMVWSYRSAEFVPSMGLSRAEHNVSVSE